MIDAPALSYWIHTQGHLFRMLNETLPTFIKTGLQKIFQRMTPFPIPLSHHERVYKSVMVILSLLLSILLKEKVNKLFWQPEPTGFKINENLGSCHSAVTYSQYELWKRAHLPKAPLSSVSAVRIRCMWRNYWAQHVAEGKWSIRLASTFSVSASVSENKNSR